MSIDAIIGLQWGDEGKGKISDLLAQEADFVVRSAGGHNAGHSIEFDGRKIAVHMLPSGVVSPKTRNVIGNGCVVSIENLKAEIARLGEGDLIGRLFVSDRAQILAPLHVELDKLMEVRRGSASIGTTLRGIGPCYADKANRNGIRAGELKDPAAVARKATALRSGHGLPEGIDGTEAYWIEAAAFLLPYVADTFELLRGEQEKSTILLEGAQAAMLDIDHGSYPFVTSSNTTVGGAIAGTGINFRNVRDVIGVTKAYCTRVGNGTFPSEEISAVGERICEVGHEYGVSTGRKRRCGWLDIVALRYAVELNGVNRLALMKIDVLDGLDAVKLCVGYERDGKRIDTVLSDYENLTPIFEEWPGWEKTAGAVTMEGLDPAARRFIERIEELVGVRMGWISTGPARNQTIAI